MIRQLSMDAFTDINADGTVSNQRLRILHLIKESADGLTRAEISQILGIPINAVTGRVNELLKYKTAYEDTQRINPVTKKKNYVLKAAQCTMS